MKKIFLMLCVATIGFSASAQNEDKPQNSADKEAHQKHRKGRDMQENFKDLNLTDAQKKQMKELNEQFKQQMQEVQKNGSIITEEQKARRKALQKQHRSDIEKLLTDEQKAKWHNTMKSHAKKGAAANGRYKKTKTAEKES